VKGDGNSGGKAGDQPTMQQNLVEHHGENTESFQDDKKIGQHNGAGRPPLMKK
jgi:hypothetical protein